MFDERFNYPGIPRINANVITNSPFEINGETITPIDGLHYKLQVFGFRIGDFTYITDAKTVAPEERDKIRGSKVLVVNALRKREHISHFNLDQALAFIEDIQPERAYLTHISHLFGTQEEIEKSLPENVFVAYDGLVIDMD